MADHRADDTVGPSTTWRWVHRKIPMAAGGQRRVERSEGLPGVGQPPARGWRRFPPYDLKRKREPLTITIVYRGGPECWYELRARGSKGRFAGHQALHDVMSAVYNDR